MARPDPVEVSCPSCEEHVTVRLRVTGVRLDGRNIIATIEPSPAQHDCYPVQPTGFTAPHGGAPPE